MTTKTNDVVVITGRSSQTPVPPYVVAPPMVPTAHGEKPEKFNEQNFKRWQQKMMFYLTTLGQVRFLRKDPPAKKDEKQDRDYLIAHEAWNNRDYLCQHYMLNCLSDSLYKVYSANKLAKEL